MAVRWLPRKDEKVACVPRQFRKARMRSNRFQSHLLFSHMKRFLFIDALRAEFHWGFIKLLNLHRRPLKLNLSPLKRAH